MKDTLLIILLLAIGYTIGYTRQDPREYQLELTPTQIYIYQGDRMVDSVSTYSNDGGIADIIASDNE
jgi:hypothetical protein